MGDAGYVLEDRLVSEIGPRDFPPSYGLQSAKWVSFITMVSPHHALVKWTLVQEVAHLKAARTVGLRHELPTIRNLCLQLSVQLSSVHDSFDFQPGVRSLSRSIGFH